MYDGNVPEVMIPDRNQHVCKFFEFAQSSNPARHSLLAAKRSVTCFVDLGTHNLAKAPSFALLLLMLLTIYGGT